MTDFLADYSDLFQAVQAAAGQTVYLVGGAVRDAMLGRPINDLDFAMKENARAAGKRIANQLGGSFYMLDEARDTARVIYRDGSGKKMLLDFATFRGESLDSDLRDRDFTANAMAIDLAEPRRLLDPTGGADDLRLKHLRMTSPRSFELDPVRVLRAVRLSLLLNFHIQPETTAAMRAAAGLLPTVSAERKRDELFRMLDGRRVDAAIRLLDRVGALPAVLPEMASLKGVAQSAPHIYDIWEHTLNAARQMEDLLVVLAATDEDSRSSNLRMGAAVLYLGRFRDRFREHFDTLLNPNRSPQSLLLLAVLYHDVSKPAKRQVDANGRVHFIEHELLGADVVRERGRMLALSALETQRLEIIVRNHMRVHQLADAGHGPSRRAIYRFFKAVGQAGVDTLLLSLADTLATYGVTLPQERWEAELRVCRSLLEGWWEMPTEVVHPPRLLTGLDIQEQFRLEPGPLIGYLLEYLQEAQATGEVASREDALRLIERKLERKDQSQEEEQGW